MTNKQKRELIETLTANIALNMSQLLVALYATDDEGGAASPPVIETTGNGAEAPSEPVKKAPKARKPGKNYSSATMVKKGDTIIFQKHKWTVTSVDPDFPTNFNARIQGQAGRPSTFAWVLAAPVVAPANVKQDLVAVG